MRSFATSDRRASGGVGLGWGEVRPSRAQTALRDPGRRRAGRECIRMLKQRFANCAADALPPRPPSVGRFANCLWGSVPCHSCGRAQTQYLAMYYRLHPTKEKLWHNSSSNVVNPMVDAGLRINVPLTQRVGNPRCRRVHATGARSPSSSAESLRQPMRRMRDRMRRDGARRCRSSSLAFLFWCSLGSWYSLF